MFSALSQDRMFLASKGYHHSLSKKKDNLALENPEKLLPIDTFGIVMITHGEEFGSDSEFGMQRINSRVLDPYNVSCRLLSHESRTSTL